MRNYVHVGNNSAKGRCGISGNDFLWMSTKRQSLSERRSPQSLLGSDSAVTQNDCLQLLPSSKRALRGEVLIWFDTLASTPVRFLSCQEDAFTGFNGPEGTYLSREFQRSFILPTPLLSLEAEVSSLLLTRLSAKAWRFFP